jgi:glutamate synthase domain-containing protein 3
MTTETVKGPIEGYVQTEPEVTVADGVTSIDCRGVYYKQVNEAVRAAFAAGSTSVRLTEVNGQRYIGTGIKGKDLRIEVHGTPGQDLAMFMDGPTVEVFGNAQDGVGNTMNAGKVVVHGDAGDVLGYGMRGGKVFIKGDVGYRVGIHMKAYENQRPIMVCGGKARDFFGEYMAGGLLVLLGLNSRIEGPLVGGYLGTGMHGGEIYVRGAVEPWQCGKEVGVFPASDEDLAVLKPVLVEYCEDFGLDLDEVLSEPFTRLVPVSHRPYGKLYTYL